MNYQYKLFKKSILLDVFSDPMHKPSITKSNSYIFIQLIRFY